MGVSNRLSLALILAISLAGCTKDPSTAQAGAVQMVPATIAPATINPIAAAVKAGSHEDWCEEHQVPESLCARCNPSLVAAFKATHDWCSEHGLPESQCRICNPNLKLERPPKQGLAK
jgi:hypothetical protein